MEAPPNEATGEEAEADAEPLALEAGDAPAVEGDLSAETGEDQPDNAGRESQGTDGGSAEAPPPADAEGGDEGVEEAAPESGDGAAAPTADAEGAAEASAEAAPKPGDGAGDGELPAGEAAAEGGGEEPEDAKPAGEVEQPAEGAGDAVPAASDVGGADSANEADAPEEGLTSEDVAVEVPANAAGKKSGSPVPRVLRGGRCPRSAPSVDPTITHRERGR